MRGAITVVFLILYTGCTKEAPTTASPVEPSVSAPQQTPRPQSRSDLSMRVNSGDQLTIVLDNHTEQPVRIFEFWNSWGWSTLSVEIRDQGASETMFTIIRNPVMVWTVNGPSTLTIEPGQELALPLTPGDKSWVTDHDPALLSGRELEVRAVLQIEHSDEAAEQDVFLGEMSSEWTPMHGSDPWLQQDMRIVPIF